MARKRLSELLREETPESNRNQDHNHKQHYGKSAKLAAKSELTAASAQANAAPSNSSGESAQPADSPKSAVTVTAEVIATQAEQVNDFVSELRSAAIEVPVEKETAPPAAATQSPADSKADDQIANLEATITQLRAELAAAQQNAENKSVEVEELKAAQQAIATEASASQQQIVSLQAKLAEQAQTIQQLQSTQQSYQQSQQATQQLQSELQTAKQEAEQQIVQLKADLETARQTILQLSQINTELNTQINTKPELKASPKPLVSTRAAEPELEPSRAQLVMPAVKSSTQIASQPVTPVASGTSASQSAASQSAAEPAKQHQLELRKMLDHPTRPGSLPPMPSEPKSTQEVKLSETDVGWID